MRDPGPVAAALVGTLDGDAVAFEPQCHCAAPPHVDAVDDWDDGAATEAGWHLGDDRIDAAAFGRHTVGAGDECDLVAGGMVATLSGGGAIKLCRWART